MNGTVYALEDDASISGLIKVALQMNGIGFESYSNIKDFYAALDKRQPDVALLDIMLPDGNGLDVLRTVKLRYPLVSCIMLSALSKEEDKVNGLNLGADDYVAKPFSVLELTARVNAALRRKRRADEVIVGGLTMNTDTMEVRLRGERLELNKGVRAFEILHAQRGKSALARGDTHGGVGLRAGRNAHARQSYLPPEEDGHNQSRNGVRRGLQARDRLSRRRVLCCRRKNVR